MPKLNESTGSSAVAGSPQPVKEIIKRTPSKANTCCQHLAGKVKCGICGRKS